MPVVSPTSFSPLLRVVSSLVHSICLLEAQQTLASSILEEYQLLPFSDLLHEQTDNYFTERKKEREVQY